MPTAPSGTVVFDATLLPRYRGEYEFCYVQAGSLFDKALKVEPLDPHPCLPRSGNASPAHDVFGSMRGWDGNSRHCVRVVCVTVCVCVCVCSLSQVLARSGRFCIDVAPSGAVSCFLPLLAENFVTLPALTSVLSASAPPLLPGWTDGGVVVGGDSSSTTTSPPSSPSVPAVTAPGSDGSASGTVDGSAGASGSDAPSRVSAAPDPGPADDAPAKERWSPDPLSEYSVFATMTRPPTLLPPLPPQPPSLPTKGKQGSSSGNDGGTRGRAGSGTRSIGDGVIGAQATPPRSPPSPSSRNDDRTPDDDATAGAAGAGTVTAGAAVVDTGSCTGDVP